MSGVSLDDVQLHYASPEPEKYEALAFKEGNHIYIAPGQEKHPGHEVWHAVQQKQRRVKGSDYGVPPKKLDFLKQRSLFF